MKISSILPVRGFNTRIKLRMLLAILFFTTSGQALAGESLEIWVDGYPYHAQLIPNQTLDSTLADHRLQATGRHYSGRLLESPDSWVRMSKIGRRWQGMVSLNGQVHIVSSESQTLLAVPAERAMGDDPATCGVGGGSVTSRSALSLPKAEAIEHQALCSETVDGICLLSELELVFDQAFQQRYPDEYPDQALSLVNMVTGYYSTALNIEFDTLTVEFPNEELFSHSTDSNTFLESIQSTKTGLSFLKNEQSLLHVVTGRSFDGSTVGLAYVNVLCERSYASGTSQIVSNDLPLTAIVVAHEIGHNFGANHDLDACGSGYIMGPSVSEEAITQGFSSCSVDEMATSISALSAPQACFNFPASLTIAPSGTNPDTVETQAVFELGYDISYRDAYWAAEGVNIRGSIPDGEGTLESVSFAGSACSVDADQLSYTCATATTPPDLATLKVQAQAKTDPMRLNQTVSLIDTSSELVERKLDDNSLTTSLTVTPINGQPNDLIAGSKVNGVELNWTDVATQESGYRVQRRLAGTTNWTVLDDTLAQDSQYFLDALAVTGNRYEYQVVALVPDLQTASNIASLLFEGPPTAPTDLQAEALEYDIELTWQDNSNNETLFRLERQREDRTDWQVIAELEANTQSFTDTSVLINHSYRYRVVAANTSFTSQASNQAEAKITLNAPRNLLAQTSGDDIALTWEDRANNETVYEVQRAGSEGKWQVIAELWADSETYTDWNVTKSETFSYRVLAYSGDTVSEPSNVVTHAIPAEEPARFSASGSLSSLMMIVITLLLIMPGLRHYKDTSQ